ncbi:hypothetical protein QQG30_25065 [Klebsiella pneumoniae]|uniref:hypothetical protein n=1 Tax=Klebsiella pneumoniae TaxID=573 RepID=UPI001072C225|nr:hypothetical protein [Klebsiella pneumoniae]EIV5423060.1 hypothetical protein [Klebsiella pneumoniae]MCL0705252.1 hypothetical protein [Klebsiella pneumoniae]MCL0726202.1 hypothetical protein [Klebsiella pneumoniae]MCL7861932.1 hypothetical protein [Klebsiella pneumoniae]MCP3119882.1 hypothetical protein [Klebsiella pneumoniae]
MNIETVNELIQSLESAGELSIREQKFLKLAKAFKQLAAENVGLKEAIPQLKNIDYQNESMDDVTLAEEIGFNAAVMAMHRWVPKTPATDRVVAGIKADGVEEFAAYQRAITEEWACKEGHSSLLKVAESAELFAKQLREGADK